MLPKARSVKKIIYLDHAATTPLDPKVEAVMRPFWKNQYGNPSSLYKKGAEAKTALTDARKKIAGILNCAPGEIIFTAGGTESINLAIFGVVKNYAPKNAHVVSTQIEHHAVLRPVEALQKQGYKTTLIGVDKSGIVNLADIKNAVKSDTVLVSVMYANNEVGTIQPISEIGKWLRAENVRRAKKDLPYINFHVDACQAAGYLSLDVRELAVDLLTLNGSKIYGPKQTGCLYVRTGLSLEPLIYGGGQEKGLRSGTENVAGIVGFAAALEMAQKNKTKELKRLGILQNYFIKRITKEIPKSFLNGASGKGERLPNNVNVSFDHIDGEALLLYLDSYGICVSTGSACSTVDNSPSHVLEAMGFKSDRIDSSIRFTFGNHTKKADLDYVLNILKPLVGELRKTS